MSKKTLLNLILVLVPVAAMVIAAAFGWGIKFPNAHFAFAFAIGGTAAVVLTVGLFTLTFSSSRRGFDEPPVFDVQTDNQRDSDEP